MENWLLPARPDRRVSREWFSRDGRNRQANWYSFKVKGVQPLKPVTIDLVDLPGEYNYQPNRGAVNAETPAVWSNDGQTWHHVEDFQYDPNEPRMRLRITPSGSNFWVAHTPPYTNRHLEQLWKDVSNAFHRKQIGRSVDGRPLWLWSIGTRPKTIWLMFRQHSWETESSWTGEGAIRELARNATLRTGYTWKIFPMAEADGGGAERRPVQQIWIRFEPQLGREQRSKNAGDYSAAESDVGQRPSGFVLFAPQHGDQRVFGRPTKRRCRFARAR